MAQSLYKIYLHIIFHVKTTSPQIADEHLERVHSYIGMLVNTTGCKVIRVGGIGDHVHIVCLLSKNETVAHLVEEVKRNSSRWIKALAPTYEHFAWQGGYAVFSVSQSQIDKVLEYVGNQAEHHNTGRMNYGGHNTTGRCPGLCANHALSGRNSDIM